jgi:hypothetical protein
MRLRRRWLLLVFAAYAVGVSPGPVQAQAPPSSTTQSRTETVETATRDISGVWEGTFTLDSAWQLPDRASARVVRARLQFNPVGDATLATSSTRSVHGGSFAIEFSRFGFTLSTSEALGWSVNPDSLRAVLNPTVDHGLVELHGTISGDSTAFGTWRYNSDPGGARGTFRLRKAGG